ncbi:hypothetical protein [Streptomyces sp. 8K308]|nr:hypothetical protein [Streptomyces sp. 8K308]
MTLPAGVGPDLLGGAPADGGRLRLAPYQVAVLPEGRSPDAQ